MSFDSQKLIRYLILFLPPLIAIWFTTTIVRGMLFLPVDSANQESVRIEIAQGKNFSEIAQDLEAKNLIRSASGLKILGRMRGDGATIKAGEYELSPSMSPEGILSKLFSGDVVRRRVLVKEGANVWEIANIVDQAGVVTKDDFLAAAMDKTFLTKLGIESPNIDGYLFPDTYFFSRPISAKDVIWTMFEEAEKKWPEAYSTRLDDLKISRHDILVLASIIQKEAGSDDEMPLISSVFHNRMKIGMKLQADPTVIYGLVNFNGNLTKDDLQNPHVYNTYVHDGLPPGAIGNPGEKAIRAALFPVDTNYLYFVADGKGRHVFSASLKEHNDNVNVYQRGKGTAPTDTPAPQG